MDYFQSKRFLDTLDDWESGGKVSGRPDVYVPRTRALLCRLGSPQANLASIVIGGTNGKGTVCSLLAALLRASGERVGLYTSPHLHTIRERIQVDGKVVSKDQWAKGVGRLYERSRAFEQEGLGPFSKFEALTALAADLFASNGVTYGVFEVGLGGRFDATNAVDADLAVLTAIAIDHAELLGHTLEEIASEKFQICRQGRPLFTTGAQPHEAMDRIRQMSADSNVPLHVAGPKGVNGPDESTFRSLPGGRDFADRPATFRQNAQLALAVAQHLLGGSFRERIAVDTVQSHTWPGRFEVARTKPYILVDGAHNPAAARRLAEALETRSRKWRFVVGVNTGHDAAGILRAIEPLAEEIVLTRTGHPRAIPAETLREHLSRATRSRCEPDGVRALKKACEGLSEGDFLCVLGSLSLVAQAREFFDLPHERDGFFEEVHLECLTCIDRASRNLGIDCFPVSEDGNILQLTFADRKTYFLRNKHPFNDYVAARLAEDKAYQIELFKNAGLPTPRTMKVFNPLADGRFDRYKRHPSFEAIMNDVERRFSYPIVIKRNRGSLAQGVYLESCRDDLEMRLRHLCESSAYFDNVLLFQAFIPGREVRVVATGDELLMAYEKVGRGSDNASDLNPLHHSDGKAIQILEPERLASLRDITRAVSRVIELGYYAIDLILSEAGPHILEVNPNPICYFYNQHNGRADFVEIYERLIRKYLIRGDDQVGVLNDRLALAGAPTTRSARFES